MLPDDPDESPVFDSPFGASEKPLDQTRWELWAIPDPPLRGAPGIPQGFNPPAAEVLNRLLKATGQEQVSAQGVVLELLAADARGDYARDFGPLAPPAQQMVARLLRAVGWSHETRNAKLWAEYAETTRKLAWDEALRDMGQLRESLDLAGRRGPDVSVRYPATRSFGSVRGRIAERAVATRRNRKAAGPA